MRTAGLIGGIGPESTVEYYRFIIESYRARVSDGSYPPIIINSIDMKRMLDGIAAGFLHGIVEFLSLEIGRLAAAGADFAVLASNTPHIVFDELRQRSTIPLISIVEAACRSASAEGLRKVGLFGTRFTMQGGFYSAVFNKAGIELRTPSASHQEYIHDKYMTELVNGIILDETRSELIRIAKEMKLEKGIDGLVLGGTELPPILRTAGEIGIPLLDTTRIHVAEIVQAIMNGALPMAFRV
jgi:aspartate racemase